MQNKQTISILSTEELEQAIQSAISKVKIEERKEIAEPKSEENLKFYTIREACKLLNCCRSTIFNYCKRGILGYKKLGRKVLFRKSDLENCGSSVSYENNQMNLTIQGGENGKSI